MISRCMRLWTKLTFLSPSFFILFLFLHRFSVRSATFDFIWLLLTVVYLMKCFLSNFTLNGCWSWYYSTKTLHYWRVNTDILYQWVNTATYKMLIQNCSEPRHNETKKVTVHPAKTQISLRIRPVWSESSLFAWRNLGSLATHWAHSEYSDQTGWMPRLIWVFVRRTLILLVLSWGGSNVMYLSANTRSKKC